MEDLKNKEPKQPNEKQAGMDGSQNITLSFSFSPSSSLSSHLSLSPLSHLSVHSLSACIPVQVVFCSTEEGKEKVSHPEWPSVQRGLPSGHISSRETDRQKGRETDRQADRQDKGKRKEEGGNVSSLHFTTYIQLTWLRSGTRGPDVSRIRPAQCEPSRFQLVSQSISLLPFSIHPPEVLRLSLLFSGLPRPPAHLTQLPPSATPGPHWSCSFVPLFRVIVCHSCPVPGCFCPAMWCFCVLSTWTCLSTCHPVCHQLPVYLPVLAYLPVSHQLINQ